MIEDPMPVFVIKAKDRLAIQAVEAYARLCQEYDLWAQADEVYKAVDEIRDWQARHESELKLPDHRHVPVTA